MTTPRQTTLRQLMAALFEIDESAIVPGIQIGDVPQWDSLGHAKLMLAVEDEFEITLSTDDISDIFTIEDIESVLDEKLGSA